MYYNQPPMQQIAPRKNTKENFSVITKWQELRKELMEVCRFNLSYNQEELERKINQMCGMTKPESLEDTRIDCDESLHEVNYEFASWFIKELRQNILDSIRTLSKEIYIANSIYSTSMREVQEVRIHQDRSIALLYLIDNELKQSLSESPIPLMSDKKLAKLSNMIQAQINLIKGWRKSATKKYDINYIQGNRDKILYEKPYYQA